MVSTKFITITIILSVKMIEVDTMKHVCQLCDFNTKTRQSLIKHVANKHNLTSLEFQYKVEKRNTCLTCHKKVPFRIVLEKSRPGYYYQFCGSRCSSLSKSRNSEYWQLQGYSETEANELVMKQRENLIKSSPNNVQSWLDKGLTKQEALDKVKEYQTLGSGVSKKGFIHRYGVKEGTERYDKFCQMRSEQASGKGNPNHGVRLNKAQKHNLSKATALGMQTYEVRKRYLTGWAKNTISSKPELDFATRLKKAGIPVEPQFPLVIDKRIRMEHSNTIGYVYDFRIKGTNLLIEFHGDYVHANPKFFLAEHIINLYGKYIKVPDIWNKDKCKLEYAKRVGFKLKVIWETDDLEGKIKEMLTYLKKRNLI